MNLFELNKYIKEEEMKGSEQLVYHKIEKHKRIAFPFASIILTLIEQKLSSEISIFQRAFVSTKFSP